MLSRVTARQAIKSLNKLRKFRLALVLAILATPAFAQKADWALYGGEGGRRFSGLSQITRDNVGKLEQAWRFDMAEAGDPQTHPLAIGGVVYAYTPTLDTVALDGATGKLLWRFHSGMKAGGPQRGLAMWGGGKDRRLFANAGSFLYALDPATGKPLADFGNGGRIDLREGLDRDPEKISVALTAPGLIWRDMIVMGFRTAESAPAAPGDIRAFDVHSGKQRWVFHTIPHPGEPGYETWPADYWKTGGGANAWPGMVLDDKRGMLFAPTGSAVSDFYGYDRIGDNLYANSLLALDANSGKLIWHFQGTHHDMWDYDAEAAPTLMDVVQGGRKTPVLVAVSKPGQMFFLHRDTGKSLYPVEERPVPQSDVPGEQSSPTQPFPLKPPPLARVSIKPDEIFTGEPEHEKFCRDLVAKIGGVHNLGPYTPYSSQEFRIIFPGQQGGPNYGGVSVDPKLNYVFVNARNVGGMGRLDKSAAGDQVAYRRFSPLGPGSVNARFWNPATQLPCQPPPWAELMAVNASTGDIAWRVPLGTSDEMEAKGVHNTGSFGQGGSIATAGGLVFIAGTIDKRFRAFDSRSGKVLWEAKLDAEGHTNPMTYLGRNGKQYVVIVSSGLNAFALE